MSHIESTDVIRNTRPIHFIGGSFIDGNLWTSALEWNGYYKLNIETGYAEFLGLFDYADIFADKLFNQVLTYQKFVFFIPWFFNYLVRLDTATLETKYWILPEKIICEIAKFRAAYLYDRRIVMFPHVGDDICVFDIEKEEFECHRNWIEELAKYKLDNKGDKFLQGYQKGEIAYVANLSDSFIMKYNLKNDDFEIILFSKYEKGIIDIAEFDKDSLLLLTSIGNVWKFNINNNNRELIYQYHGETETPYRHVIVQQDCFYLLPAKESSIKFIDNRKEDIVSYPDDWKLQYINVNIESTFNGYSKNGNMILLYPCMGNMIIEIEHNVISSIVVNEDIKYRAKEISKWIADFGMQKRLLYEPKANLDLLLGMIDNGNKEENTGSLKAIGIKIWNIVKGI